MRKKTKHDKKKFNIVILLSYSYSVTQKGAKFKLVIKRLKVKGFSRYVCWRRNSCASWVPTKRREHEQTKKTMQVKSVMAFRCQYFDVGMVSAYDTWKNERLSALNNDKTTVETDAPRSSKRRSCRTPRAPLPRWLNAMLIPSRIINLDLPVMVPPAAALIWQRFDATALFDNNAVICSHYSVANPPQPVSLPPRSLLTFGKKVPDN